MQLRPFKNEIAQFIDLSKEHNKVKIDNGKYGILEIVKNRNRILMNYTHKYVNNSYKKEKSIFLFDIINSFPVVTKYKAGANIYSVLDDSDNYKIFIENKIYGIIIKLVQNGFSELARNLNRVLYRAKANVILMNINNKKIQQNTLISEKEYLSLPDSIHKKFEKVYATKDFEPEAIEM